MQQVSADRPRPDFWPLARLFIVAGAFYAAGCLVYGWKFDPGAALGLLRGIAGTLGVLAFISVTVAATVLFLLMVPLHVVVLLNDWFYNGANWTLRTLLRIRSRPLLALLSLSGELFLFAAAFVLLRRFFAGL